MAGYLVSEGGSRAQLLTELQTYEYYCLKYQIPMKNMENYTGLTGRHQYCMIPDANTSY